jgi:hypothetical protein
LPVPTVIATTTNLEAEVSPEGAEAVADAEEDQEKQEEVEEDLNGCIYRIEKGGTRGAPPRRKFGRDNNSKSGGVNGIGGEDEQYDEY